MALSEQTASPQLGRIDPETLGFDFDCVIADTAETFLRLACEQYDYCGFRLEQITDFEVEDCLGIRPEIVNTIFQTIMEDSLATGLNPMPGALEVLEALTAQATVTVVTARSLPDPVYDWLEAMLPRTACRRIRLVAMGDKDDKVRHIHHLGLHHFIDDRAATCLQLIEAGFQPIVYHQPWNQNRHSLPLVRNWQQIRDLCL